MGQLYPSQSPSKSPFEVEKCAPLEALGIEQMDPHERYTRHVMKVATTQICQELGLHKVQCSVVDTIADIATKCMLTGMVAYGVDMEQIGETAAQYANLARRHDVNFHDIDKGIEELGENTLDVLNFVQGSDSLPFYFELHEFPLKRSVTRVEAKDIGNEVETPPSNVPAFLPKFPPLHTYKSTPQYPKRTEDAKTKRKVLIREKRELESSLVRMDRSKAAESGTGPLFGETKDEQPRSPRKAKKRKQDE